VSDDGLLSEQDEQEAYSLAYASAVAAKARYTIAIPIQDRDSIDIVFSAGGPRRPSIAAQLKATINLGSVNAEGNFSYSLKKKNYDDLIELCQTPRILIVLDMPVDPLDWMNISEDELIIKRKAYWVHLVGLPETDNTSGKTVYIPKINVFNEAALSQLIERSRKGEMS